jgi:AraC-like DNA-binding protein
MPDKVREDTFTTRDMPEKEQFDFWREQVSPMLDVSRTNDARAAANGGFVAEAKGYDLGKILIAQATMDSEAYVHTADHIRKSASNHWLLTVRKKGFAVSRSGDRVLESTAGTLELRSLAFPYSGSSSETEALYVFLDRDEFSGMAAELDGANHTVLKGNTSTLVREFLLKVENYLPSLRLSELSVIHESISTLVAASMQPNESKMEDAQLPLAAARFELARRYIEAHLADPELNAERVSQALGISRRQIYYLFEKHNGVANFIRKRRLAACHNAIANIADHRLIQTIAYKYGFGDPAQFSRQFRREYGYSPSDARHAKLLGHRPDPSRPRTFFEWLNQVRKD